MKKNNFLFILGCITALIISSTGCSKEETKDNAIKDIDGNVYHSITIGTQTWMLENLKVTKFASGTPISVVTDSSVWNHLLTPACCWSYNDIANKNTYGALYNGYAAGVSNICPEGWHVPSSIEWTTLATNLGGADVAGGKLKETGTNHWWNPNQGATNETGFTAVPGGTRFLNGDFDGLGASCVFWSTFAYDDNNANAWDMSYVNTVFYSGYYSKKCGYSIRCIKD